VKQTLELGRVMSALWETYAPHKKINPATDTDAAAVPTQKLRPKLRIGHRKRGGTGHEDEGHDKTVLIEATIAAQAKQTICLAG